MNHKYLLRYLMIAAVLALVGFSNSAIAQTSYGSLSNFDALTTRARPRTALKSNSTGAFPRMSFPLSAPHTIVTAIRRSRPTARTPSCVMRARYSGGTWAVGTDSGTFAPTGGHSLFFSQYGGDPAYPNVPGDHFGVALSVNPTNTIYHWLLDDGNGHARPGRDERHDSRTGRRCRAASESGQSGRRSGGGAGSAGRE